MPQFSRIFLGITLLVIWQESSRAITNTTGGGRVVWWGNDIFWNDPRLPHRDHTNGIVENDGDFLCNVVAIAAHSDALILRSDGTVFARGLNSSEGRFEPAAFSNVVSVVANGTACWAINRDGTVTGWGIDIENGDKTIGALTNVVSIAQGGPNSVFVLKNDGSAEVLHTKPSTDEAEIDQLTGMPITNDKSAETVALNEQGRSNLVAIAFDFSCGFLALGKDGTINAKGLKFQVFDPTTGQRLVKRHPAGPLSINGQVLSNVVAIAAGDTHCIVLRQDGTVMAWGSSYGSQTDVPPGLSNVIAIAAGSQHSLALRRDGTVVAWGEDYSGQTSVPPGLSNVVAIAAGGDFSLALIAGAVPASVYIQPHGRLGELEREADFIFKGQVLSTTPATNASFPDWGKPHATQFKVISVLKGRDATNAPIFWHNTSGPMGWSGGSPPSDHQFEPGQSYLVFAVRLDRPAYLYVPPPDATNRINEFRQTYRDGVVRTLDARPISEPEIKAVHWSELNLLLNDTNPSNRIYAIGLLDKLSPACGPYYDWLHTKDFKRREVLRVVLPKFTDLAEDVAVAAIGCFQLGGMTMERIQHPNKWRLVLRDCPQAPNDCIIQMMPLASNMIAVANSSTSTARRVAAIAALSGTRSITVSNALPKWLADNDEFVRAMAVQLLPEYPGENCKRLLRERAADTSAVVRAAAADAIGRGRIDELLPTLVSLFSESVRQNDRDYSFAYKVLQPSGKYASLNSRDVHASAGYALLNFNVQRVEQMYKANLSDPDFGPEFLCILAEQNPREWLEESVKYIERRVAGEKQITLGWGTDVHYRLWNVIYDYLQGLPFDAFAKGKAERYLNILEKSDKTGSREPQMLYELYKMKGLNRRAAKYREEYEPQFAKYGMADFFDKVDAKYPKNGTIPSQ